MENTINDPTTKWDELLADFNLFLCEYFGYREAAYYNRICNGNIICA
ncbi:MAG: hypothetical protein LIO79_10275 [Rikenellaceae bacterium]|nr:hypothetical protein [Rikenellaceae bacterium]